MPLKTVWKKSCPSNKSDESNGNGDSPAPKVTLSLDKLALTLKSKDGSGVAALVSSLSEAAAGPSNMVKNLFYVNPAPGSSDYAARAWLAVYVGITSHRILIETGPKKSKLSDVRVEFNPSALGPIGVTRLKHWLRDYCPPWVHWNRVVTHAKATRVDVAVDVEGVRIDTLNLASKRHGECITFTSKGRLETIYFGTDTKPHRRPVVYDKRREIKKRLGVDPGMEITRFEVRLYSNFSALAEIQGVKNPLKVFEVSSVATSPGLDTDWKYRCFLDSVRFRGAHAALAMLPKHQRHAYKARLFPTPPIWWEPTTIWSKWPSVVGALGLLSVKGPKAA